MAIRLVCCAQSCIGVKFSIIEIKMFMFILVTNFKFAECDKVGKANVYVLFCSLIIHAAEQHVSAC